MDLKIALETLKKSKDFRKWKDSHKDAYFSYAFKIPQEMSSEEWQMGFYNKNSDRITTFVLNAGKVAVRTEEEIFKRDGVQVNEIDLGRIILTLDNAIEKADKFQKKNFPKDSTIKTIAILQNMEDYGNIWNITYLTQTFNTLNMKIDASSGKVLEHNLASVFSFKK